MLNELKNIFNKARVMDLEEGSGMEVRKGMYIDFPNGEELRLEEGDTVVLERKMSPDWDYMIEGKRTQVVKIRIDEKTATVGVDYVQPLKNKRRRV